VFCVFDRNRWPWRPPRRCDARTRPMAASSGFKWSPGCASLGDVPRMAPLHPHGHRNWRRFACILCHVDFIVGHNHKLKTMLWLIKSIYELPICSLVCYQPICIIWAPAVDDGCRFGHHFWRCASDSSKTRVVVELQYFLCYCIVLY